MSAAPTTTGATAPAGEGTLTLRLGTRRSRLAVTQSLTVAEALRARGHTVEVVEIVTEGDTNGAPLTQIGGTGVFASAIRAALLEGSVDIAVHSLKDLPVAPEPGLVVAAIPAREDPRDALVSRDGSGVEALPAGAVVGTGSPRRAAQLAVRRPDLRVRAIRGNVDSRLRRVHDGDIDAVLLAGAGLARLGLSGQVSEFLDPQLMLPAPGQGALGVECRADRPDVVAALTELDDAPTRACVSAERALLAALEAGCTAPIGALGRIDDAGALTLTAFVGETLDPDALDEPGQGHPGAARWFRLHDTGAADDPVTLGAALARRLLDAGAAALRPGARERDAPTASEGPTSPLAQAAATCAAPASSSRDQNHQE